MPLQTRIETSISECKVIFNNTQLNDDYHHDADCQNVDCRNVNCQNVYHQSDENGNTLIHIASASQPLSVIKYLIEQKSMDPMKKTINNQGMDCLMMGCFNQIHGTRVIDYYVETFHMDTNDTNCFGQNCLAIACQVADLGLIQHLIERYWMDPLLKDLNGIDCLTTAIFFNRDLDVIKYLMDRIGQSVINKRYAMKISENNRCNILWDQYVCDNQDILAACENNHNPNVLQHLVETMRIGPENLLSRDSLRIGCMRNSANVIKYLFSIVKLDQMIKQQMLFYASRYNPDLDVIKYLVEELNYVVDGIDTVGNNCLLFAAYNPNPQIIRYMIEELKMDPNVENRNGEKCFELSLCKATQHNVPKYLIESTSVPIKLSTSVPIKLPTYFQSRDFHKIIMKNLLKDLHHNPQRINEFVRKIVRRYGSSDVFGIDNILCINPLLFDPETRDLTLTRGLRYIDPFESEYQSFVRHADALRSKIPLSYHEKRKDTNLINVKENEEDEDDEDEEDGLLFANNGIPYHGSRKIVYGAIPLLDDMLKDLDFTDPGSNQSHGPSAPVYHEDVH
jgi:hypothetical protein